MLPEAALLLALLPVSPAADPTGPWARWHFVFSATTEMSILFRRDATGDETRLLLRCAAGRFELVSRQDPSGRDSTESVRSLEEAETFARRLRFGRLDAVAACGEMLPVDACVVFTGKNGTLAAPLSGFAGERGAGLRARGASLVSPGMKKRLAELCPMLTFAAEFGSYTDDFLGLVWPESCAHPLSLRRGSRTRGCDDDAAFGHPCTPEEREREEKRFSGRDSRRRPAESARPTGTPPRPPRG